jgi:RIO kinase 1
MMTDDLTDNPLNDDDVNDVKSKANNDVGVDVGVDVDDTTNFEFMSARTRHRNDSQKPALKKKAHEGKRTKADERKTFLRTAAASSVEADVFNPTYQGSRHEQEMILNSFGDFYHDHVITDVLRVVKAGKEATVYCCKAHPNADVKLIAGKIYRPRMFRNLKNDSMYRVGTQMRDVGGAEMRKEREQRAVAKRTKVGHQILHSSWLSNEISVMKSLHAAGAIVPKPFANNDNAVLMEYLGDATRAAPPLESVTLETREAHRLFKLIIDNIKLMLAHDVVHGDLSAFNILYWEGEGNAAGIARIIDFPQAVNPYKNPYAYKIFSRDVERVCDYFSQYGIGLNAFGLARDLWREVMGLDPSEIRDIQQGRWNA